jgi:excisionase family DNA binding protein
MDRQKPSRNTQTPNAGTLTDAAISELSKLLQVGDAAKFLAVSKRTLQQLTADRSVAHIKFGRNVRYDIADLRRFAESRKIREIGWKAASKKATTVSTGGREA